MEIEVDDSELVDYDRLLEEEVERIRLIEIQHKKRISELTSKKEELMRRKKEETSISRSNVTIKRHTARTKKILPRFSSSEPLKGRNAKIVLFRTPPGLLDAKDENHNQYI